MYMQIAPVMISVPSNSIVATNKYKESKDNSETEQGTEIRCRWCINACIETYRMFCAAPACCAGFLRWLRCHGAAEPWVVHNATTALQCLWELLLMRNSMACESMML